MKYETGVDIITVFIGSSLVVDDDGKGMVAFVVYFLFYVFLCFSLIL